MRSFALLLLLAACAAPPDGTFETHDLTASSTGHDYVLTVFVPSGSGPWDTVYVFDGDDWTDTVAHQAEDHLIVGIGYGDGPNKRGRDYTPDGPGIPDGHGQVEAFYGFVTDDLVPFVDGTWETNASAEGRTLIGHSFGGTAALWGGLHHADLFGQAVSISPSLAFGRGALFEAEADYAADHDDLTLRLYLGAGGLEAHGLAGLTEAFGEVLDSRDYPGLALQTKLESGHVHSSVFPVAAEHGLDFVWRGR